MKTIATAILLLVCACGGAGGSPAGLEPLPDLNGTWDAVVHVTGGNQAPPGAEFAATLDIQQDGESVSGTFVTEQGLEGEVSGTVAPDGLRLDFDMTQFDCDGAFSGWAVTGDGFLLGGEYGGSDCNGTLVAEFTAWRRQ